MKQEFFVGLDLGQASDFTALCVLERVKIPVGEVNTDLEQPTCTELHCRHLERLPLGTSYPAIVASVTALLETPPLKGHVTLALDATGVGRPVADMFQTSALTCPCYAVIITEGDSVARDGSHVRIPKRDLVGAVQVALQNSALKIASALPHAPTLVTELLNFRVKIDPQTAHDSYSSWREAEHDDLVLAVSMAVWLAQESQPVRFIRLTGV